MKTNNAIVATRQITNADASSMSILAAPTGSVAVLIGLEILCGIALEVAALAALSGVPKLH